MLAAEPAVPIVYIREKLSAAWAVLVAAIVGLKDSIVMSFWAGVLLGARFFYRNRKTITRVSLVAITAIVTFLLTRLIT